MIDAHEISRTADIDGGARRRIRVGWIRKILATIGLSVALLAIGAIAANAGNPNQTTHGADNFSFTGASFAGSWYFYATGTNNGGYGYPGKLCDTNTSDPYDVFVHAKTEGYGYGTRTYSIGGPGGCVNENMYVYDYQATSASYGNTQVCVDRGTLLPDICQDHDHTRP